MNDMERDRNRINEYDDENQVVTHRRRNTRAQKIRMMRAKATLIGVAVLVVALVGLIIYIAVSKSKENDLLKTYQQMLEENREEIEQLKLSNEVEISATTLAKMIEPASELVSYKYYYTAASVYEDSKKFFGSSVKVPFTTDKSVLMVDGIINVGVDISGVKFDVNDGSKTINVTLPSPKIISHELDTNSFQYFDIKNSVFNSSNLGDYANLESALKQQQEEKLMANTDFWDKAKENAKATISSLMNASGKLDEYSINYTWE